MRDTAKALGAGGAALGASAVAFALGVCCVSPWAVTLLGVGGAVLFARATFVQPYLAVAALVLLAAGLWLVYRRSPEDGTRPAWLRALIWIAAAAVIAIDVASFAPSYFS